MTGILKDLADGAKRLSEIKKDFSDLDFKEEILGLRELLFSVKEQVLELQEENRNLRSDLAEAKSKDSKQKELIEIEGFKFDRGTEGAVGLPYCPKCEVAEKGLMYRLAKLNDQFSKCPNCKNDFNVAKDGSVHQKVQQRAVTVKSKKSNRW